MPNFVTITGIGLVTPLGDSAASTWDALLRGESIRDHSKVNLPDAPAVPRVTAIALRAASEAVRQARWSGDTLASPGTALIIATSKGPVESWLDGKLEPDGLAGVASGVAAAMKIGCGPRLTISAACASGLCALIRGAMMLQCEQVDRVLVIGAEASVHPLFLGSFRRLGVLAPAGGRCMPFDLQRKGFLMSDAAAAICLERGDGPAIARVENFAMGADATHLTGSDPDGATLRRLLSQVIRDNPIDLIHAHGTGTVTNDAIELNAVEQTLEKNACRPALYSHKGAIGHSLGAAGVVSIALSCLMHRAGTTLPNPNLHEPLATRRVELNTGAIRRPIKRSVSIAAGFGGSMAAISLVSD